METKKDAPQQMITLSLEQKKKLWRAVQNTLARAKEQRENQLIEGALNEGFDPERDINEQIAENEILRAEMKRAIREHNLTL